jgi:hypothetical protein
VELAAAVSSTDAERWRLLPIPQGASSSAQPQPPAEQDCLRYVAGLDTSTVDQPDMCVPTLTFTLADATAALN